jgi:hypothetical protein
VQRRLEVKRVLAALSLAVLSGCATVEATEPEVAWDPVPTNVVTTGAGEPVVIKAPTAEENYKRELITTRVFATQQKLPRYSHKSMSWGNSEDGYNIVVNMDTYGLLKVLVDDEIVAHRIGWCVQIAND